MATRKIPDSSSFGELIGVVAPLEPGPRRLPARSVPEPRVKVRASARPELHISVIGDVLIGHAPDVSEKRAHELRHGPVPPVRRLDLHRMGAAKARTALQLAVRQARADRIASLVIVFGRGTHSGRAGPVLPGLVQEELSGPLAKHVLAFRSAPPALGGSGALIVRLRR